MADSFQLKAIITAVDKMTPALKGIQRSVKITHKSLTDIGRAGSKLMSSIGIPAGLAFSGIAYGAVRATRAALEYGGAIQDAAERTGASVEGYQTLGNMLGEVGGSAEDAEMAFTKFNKGIAEAAAGADKNFAGLMKKMRIPLRNAKGELVSLTDVLPDLAQAFVNTKDPATRTRMAMELWGKSGSRMIPIMLRGRDGVKAWVKEQERLGAVLGGDAVGALDNLGDSFGFVGTQIRTQWASALAKMVPVVQPLIKQLTEWIAANKELIQTNIVSFITDLTEAIKSVDWIAFMKDVKQTVKEVRSFVDSVGGMKNIMIGMGAAFLAGPVAAVLSIGGAVARAVISLGSLLFTVKATGTGYAAMGAIPAINAMLGASFVWLRTQVIAAALVLRMGGVAGLASAAMASIGSAVAAVGTAFMGAARAVLLVSRALLLSPLGIVMALATAAYLIYENWDTLKKWFGEFFDWMGKKFTQLAEWSKSLIPDWAKDLLGGGSVNINQAAASGAIPPRSPLVAGSKAQVNGEMTVRFENAPPGMRVDQGKTNQSGLAFNPDVGYRSLGFGL